MTGTAATALHRRLIRAGLNPGRATRSAAALAKRAWRTRLAERAGRRFDARAARLLEGVSRPEQPKAIIAYCDSGFTVLRGVYALTGRTLCRMSALPLYLMPEIAPARLTDPSLAALEGSLVRIDRNTYRRRGHDDAGPTCRWDVDWRIGAFRAEGIDFGPAIAGMLRRNRKCYEIDFEDPVIRAEASNLLRSADAALGLCLDLESAATRLGVPIRVLAGELNYVPGGIFNLFCSERGRSRGMEFVDLGLAYSHYFRVGAQLGEEFSVQNVTRRAVHSRFDVGREAFDRWLAGADRAETDKALEQAHSIITQSRTARDAPPAEAQQVLRRLAAHRAEGKPVACLFGHLTFDLAGLRDQGLVHGDMAEWLNDTVRRLADSETLVLVKPHVAEGRYKGNRAPKQRFCDLLRMPLPGNFILLDPLWFNAHELFSYIDAGIVWRSTVAIELSIAGIPAIVAGRECYFRDALDLLYPTDEERFDSLLRAIGTHRTSAELPGRAAMLLRYIEEELTVRLRYFRTTHSSAGLLRVWDDDALKEFIAHGDPDVDRLCRKILS